MSDQQGIPFEQRRTIPFSVLFASEQTGMEWDLIYCKYWVKSQNLQEIINMIEMDRTIEPSPLDVESETATPEESEVSGIEWVEVSDSEQHTDYSNIVSCDEAEVSEQDSFDSLTSAQQGGRKRKALAAGLDGQSSNDTS